MSHPFQLFLRHYAAWGVASSLLATMSSCSPLIYKKPATAWPHAFISYKMPKPGDKNLRVGVKDLIDMKGEVTSAGSEYMLKNRKPAAEDAPCMKIIRQRKDVTVVGKTNLSEFAVGVSGSNDYFGTPVNPIDNKRVPGGSSSGSAVALAWDLADVTLGTDTAGSIRVPAACCGVAGLKTTFGMIPIKGVYPISPTYLDTVGPMARDVKGLVTGMELLKDGFSGEYAKAKAAKPTAAKIKIGRLYIPGTDKAIDKAIDARLEAKGFQVVRLSDEFLKQWLEAQDIGGNVGAAGSWYSNQSIEHQHGIENRAKRTMFFGDIVYSLRFKNPVKREKAIAKRAEFWKVLDGVFSQVDAIALPVLKKTPPTLNWVFTGLFEGSFLKLQCTMACNYSGIPAMALPVPMPGEPFPMTSIQVAGPKYSEAALLNIGRLLE